MSVLIKGMQMPKCCRECDAEGHYDNSYGDEYGFFCPFGYKAYTSETRELKRLDNCPLAPVPEHGRLIDESEFFARLDDGIKTISSLSLPEDFVAVYTQLVKEVKEEIGKCRTIIPAEEGEIAD